MHGAPGQLCPRINWSRQAKQVGHTAVWTWIYTYRTTTRVLENYKLASRVPSWWTIEESTAGSALAPPTALSMLGQLPVSQRLSVTPVPSPACVMAPRRCVFTSRGTFTLSAHSTLFSRVLMLTWVGESALSRDPKLSLSVHVLCRALAVISTRCRNCMFKGVAWTHSCGDYISFSGDAP